MKTKITDNWEVELINDRGDTLTLKGEWYADFFKEYDNKQLIIADVVRQSEQLKAFADWCDKQGLESIEWSGIKGLLKEYESI